MKPFGRNTGDAGTALDLQRFADGAGTGAGEGAGTAAESGTAAAAEGRDAADKATADAAPQTAQDKAAAFRRLIQGDYKAESQAWVQGIIDKRFAKSKATEEALAKREPLMAMLADKYGVQADDVDGLVKALNEDKGFYEEAAMREGLSVEQYKHLKQLERENRGLQEAEKRRQAEAAQQQAMAALQQEIETAQKIYPDLDLSRELNDPKTGRDFDRLLRSGVPVQTVFEVVHKDDIIGGAMQYTARRVSEKLSASVQANRGRPVPAGNASSAAAKGKLDVNSMTKAQRRELAARAAAGERIVL